MSIVRAVTLPVTLEHDFKSGDPDNMLVINGGEHSTEFDQIDLEHNPTQLFHTITLELSGNASAGEFCQLGDPVYPGFAWLLRKPGFIPVVPQGKTAFLLYNMHQRRDTRGRWFYQLCARFGEMVYGVPLTFAAGPATNKNPSIKNR
ncbi:MAG TPA: hypothetical protein VFJ87_10315 [Rhodanobacteraceae bacterium]|jgi:hypothetical protein|nr:hypothetical protein [Rhodanobacteraceae bacterium]